VYGPHDAGWLAFYDYFREAVGLSAQTEKISGLVRAAKSAGWWIPHQKICWVSERHSVLILDDRGLLHCASGPSVAYPDGWAIYAWHGVRVPERIITQPETITAPEIDAESNSEVRRVMLERFGVGRYIQESGAKCVSEYPDSHQIVGLRTAKLYSKELNGDEPIVMLDMLNSTPEPDGATKRYLIRVDPAAYGGLAAKDCLAAMASTYRRADGSMVFARPEDYAPYSES
jgi:hypothetical protein